VLLHYAITLIKDLHFLEHPTNLEVVYQYLVPLVSLVVTLAIVVEVAVVVAGRAADNLKVGTQVQVVGVGI